MKGDPEYINLDIERYKKITAEQISSVAKLLNDNRVSLSVLPKQNLTISSSTPDRTKMPVTQKRIKFDPPSPQRMKLNNNVDKSYSISLLAIKNLEDTKNIYIQIDKLKYILNNDLIKNIERILNSSNADSEIINSALNLDILINSISDKIDMILGGASPIAMAFYSEEIVNIFDEVYNLSLIHI